MKLFKKLGTYFSMLTLVLGGTSFKSFASEGEEGSEAFDDPNAESEDSESAENETSRLINRCCSISNWCWCRCVGCYHWCCFSTIQWW